MHARQAIAILFAAMLVVAGCDVDNAEQSAAAPSAPDLPPAQIASCGEAGLGTPPTQGEFGDEATFAGPLGLVGPGRKLRGPATVKRPDGSIAAKIGAVVVGARRVELSVPDEYAHRVALDYGDLRTAPTFDKAHPTVIFKPCGGRKRTGFPGGLLFKTRKPFELEVRSVRTGRVWMLPLGPDAG
jgi:hypothetical protein